MGAWAPDTSDNGATGPSSWQVGPRVGIAPILPRTHLWGHLLQVPTRVLRALATHPIPDRWLEERKADQPGSSVA